MIFTTAQICLNISAFAMFSSGPGSHPCYLRAEKTRRTRTQLDLIKRRSHVCGRDSDCTLFLPTPPWPPPPPPIHQLEETQKTKRRCTKAKRSEGGREGSRVTHEKLQPTRISHMFSAAAAAPPHYPNHDPTSFTVGRTRSTFAIRPTR